MRSATLSALCRLSAWPGDSSQKETGAEKHGSTEQGQRRFPGKGTFELVLKFELKVMM